MVQRTRRGLSPEKAREMLAKLKAFHHNVRKWCGEIPIGSTLYVALDALVSSLILTAGSSTRRAPVFVSNRAPENAGWNR